MMMKIKRQIFSFLLVLAFLSFTYPLVAQLNDGCGISKNKKALKYFNEALAEYKQKNNASGAINLCVKAIEADAEYAEAYLLIGDAARKLKDYKRAKESYIKVIELCPDMSSDAYYHLGTYFYSLKKYKEAIKYLRGFTEVDNKPESKRREEIDELYAKALIYDQLYNSPVPFDPKPLDSICSFEDEYLPGMSPDNEIIFYTRQFQKTAIGELTPKMAEEFSMSKRKGSGAFPPGMKMSYPFNQNDNEGGASISIDNKFMYFTICRQEGSKINCDIYYSEFINNSWSEINNLGSDVNSPDAWDSQPSISPDGKTLYFVSNREGGYGGIDIYKTTKSDSGKWAVPVNLGTEINTEDHEKSPFIHPDNKTFYFSSKGHPGLGGFDIFFSKLNENGSFSKPKNIGYPINSDQDDLGFFVSTDGLTGYFASNKHQGKGGWDIYHFDLYPGARPEKVLFIKGEVRSDQAIPLAARIELKNVKTNEIQHIQVDSLTGKYASVVLFDQDYIMTVKKEGFAYSSRYFSAKDSALNSPKEVDLTVKPIEVGTSYKLENILFGTNSYELEPESKTVIDGFVQFLDENPKVKISIHGYTDDIGDDQSNQILSEERSKSVYSYIIQSGVQSNRVNYKGFGEKNPVADNSIEVGRALNRRTEFVITAK